MKKSIFVIILMVILTGIADAGMLSFGVGVANLASHYHPKVYSLRYEINEDIVTPFLEVDYFSSDEAYGALGIVCSVTPYFKLGASSGYLSERNGGMELGSKIEFQSFMEVIFTIDDKYDIGLNISHMSNAHLGKANPGMETIKLIIYF